MSLHHSINTTIEYARDRYKQNLLINDILNDRELKKYIKKLVQDKRVTISQEEVLHDTIISFLRTIMQQTFTFKTNPIAYIKTIAKNIVLMNLRKKIISYEALHLHVDSIRQDDLYLINSDRKEIIDKLLSNISIECRKILELWAYHFKMSEIQVRLGYNSHKYVKKKKNLCMKKLVLIVDQNPKFKKELGEHL